MKPSRRNFLQWWFSLFPLAGSKVREPGPTEGSRFYRGTPGFMAVILTTKEMHVEIIDYTGARLYETRVQQRSMAGG